MSSLYVPTALKITCNLFAQNEKISSTYNESNNRMKQLTQALRREVTLTG